MLRRKVTRGTGMGAAGGFQGVLCEEVALERREGGEDTMGRALD